MTTPPPLSRLADGFHDVPPGRIAAVVTHLEMTAPPPPGRPAPPEGWQLGREGRLTPDAYRALFRRIGEPWLWFSRLRMADDAIAAILSDPASLLSILHIGGEEAGLVELSFREAGGCEIVFFGLTPGSIGRGAGRFMMAHALAEAWSRPGLRRVTVHTCTLDHPSALSFYLRSGFRAVGRQVEIAPDPRLQGLLSPTAAPHVPVIPAPATPGPAASRPA